MVNSKYAIAYCMKFTCMHVDRQHVYILSILYHCDFPPTPEVLSIGGIAGLTSGLIGSIGVCTGVPILIVVYTSFLLLP